MSDRASPAAAAALAAEGIVVSFGGRRVLDHVSLAVADGEIVALRGPSGSGKTTLLRVLTGLVTADAGVVLVNGEDVTHAPTHRRRIGMVFQDNQLFPHKDVAGNVEFGLRMLRVPTRDRGRRVEEVLALVGLDGFQRRNVTSLSGGEAKRVALARSLAPQPSAILLDEPLTGLDRDLHDQLADDLSRVLRGNRISTVLVTHDAEEAAAMSDRTVQLASPPSMSQLSTSPPSMTQSSTTQPPTSHSSSLQSPTSPASVSRRSMSRAASACEDQRP